MPNLAFEIRPSIVGALALTLGLAIGLRCAPRSECSKRAVPMIRMQKPVIVAMELAPPKAPSLPGDVLTPPAHPDARPWPHGMVIMPPPTHDAIQVRLPGPLEKLVSAVLAAVLPQAS